MPSAPRDVPPSTDPLGEALHLLKLTGTLYCRAELSSPWGVAVPPLDGVMTFVIVTAGECWLEVEGDEPRRLRQGSLALVSRAAAHRIRSSRSARTEPLFDIPVEQVSERYEIMRHGGGGEVTHAMYGVVHFDHVAARRLVALLPAVVHIDEWSEDEGSWLRSTLRFITSEASALRTGGETVITRLADILVIQAIRAWIESAPRAERGWLAALRDPRVGRALASIHRAPEKDWTVGGLAKEVAMSRSAFSARFTSVVGEAPMHYLAAWRLELAHAELGTSTEPLGVLAERVGYRSEAAFCRAFVRKFGASPGSVRRAAPSPAPR